MVVLRVCYKSGVRFHDRYYVSRHIPLAASVFEPLGGKSGEMVRVTATPDGSRPPYQVVFSIYFDSQAQLQQALQSPRMPEVLGDMANYYDGTPDILIGEVVALGTAH